MANANEGATAAPNAKRAPEPVTDVQRAWFKEAAGYSEALHLHSHTFPWAESNNPGAIELTRIYQALADLLDLLTSTSSWDAVEVHSYDMRDFADKLNRRFATRLVVQDD